MVLLVLILFIYRERSTLDRCMLMWTMVVDQTHMGYFFCCGKAMVLVEDGGAIVMVEMKMKIIYIIFLVGRVCSC